MCLGSFVIEIVSCNKVLKVDDVVPVDNIVLVFNILTGAVFVGRERALFKITGLDWLLFSWASDLLQIVCV